MPRSSSALQSIAVRNAAAEEDADRIRRRDFYRGAAACLGWSAIGSFAVMWSAHTTDVTLGQLAFFAGVGIGNGGIIFTLLAVYRRGEARGDW